MPKTRAQIDAIWEPLHAKLTKLYYEEKAISKELFNNAHSVIWLLHEQESIQNGIIPDFEIDEVTKKKRSDQIIEILTILKTADVDSLINQLKTV